MRLVFVTGNAGKFAEAQAALGDTLTLVQDAGGYPEIQADTLREVAAHGLHAVGNRLAPPFFLEDAGLFVDALSGFPGVYSAYVHKTLGWNGVLTLLAALPDAPRSARFEAVIGYRDTSGADHLFTGVVHGHILPAARGSKGFGFDPIFAPVGSTRSFAQMPGSEKTALSHRGQALAGLARHLALPEPVRPREKAS